MEPKIASFQYHGGAPLISRLSRTPGYRITGQEFGDQPGTVEIEYARDDEMRSQYIKSWSDTFIEIERPGHDAYDWSVWINDLFVTRADGKRSKPFEIARPSNPYVGYIRPQDRPGGESQSGGIAYGLLVGTARLLAL